ncbi:hypothetical protein HNQ56_002651 [Anaerotaenia torta]|uniref:efflux RND transporter periplasmic adaptor subunit n=1 Tax=Anaerotaenia torta TaxID=433293 RepID=UPI003D1AEDA8
MKQRIAGIAIAFLLVFLTSCSGAGAILPVLSESIKTQEDTAVVTTGDLALMEYYDGVIKPETIEIAAPRTGIMKEWSVSLGDYVKEGDAIAVLYKTNDFVSSDWNRDKEDVRYRLQEIELKLTILETKLKVLKKAGKDTSSAEFEIILLDMRELELEKEYLNALTGLDYEPDSLSPANREGLTQYDGIENEDFFVVTAPEDGTVVYREGSSKGEKISAATVVCILATEKKILECSYLKNHALTNAKEVYGMIHGNKVTLVQDETEENDNILSYISSSEGKTDFRLSDNDIVLEAGDYIPIYMVVQKREKVNYVPVDALYSDTEGYYIYVLSGGEWKITRVEIGLMTASYVEITSNIQEGEVVLVAK